MYAGVNEHSLHGQLTEAQFAQFLTVILECRYALRLHGAALRCRSSLVNRPVVGSATLGEFLQRLPAGDNRKRLCLSWLTTDGPFLEDELLHHIGCEYHCGGELVTDGILAELAHRQLHGISTPAAAISASPSVMESDPLGITFDDGTSKADVPVRNFVQPEGLRSWLSNLEQPCGSWQNLEQRARRKCLDIHIADRAFAPLERQPFNLGAAGRLLDQLDVLQRLKVSFDESGAFTPEGQRLRQLHFTGDKAWFTDSSDSEKRDFKDDMTFPHPERRDEKLLCTWHGKVKTPQLRIHFSFPIAKDAPLYVVYVGPKITKR